MKGLDTYTYLRHGEAFNAGPPCINCGHRDEIHHEDSETGEWSCENCDCTAFEAMTSRDMEPDEPYEG
jgi:phage/plasmid primase-like uncharacterized protein